MIDAALPMKWFQDTVTRSGQEDDEENYDSATSYLKEGFDYVLKVTPGFVSHNSQHFDKCGLSENEVYFAEWEDGLHAGYSTYYPYLRGERFDRDRLSFVMTHDRRDACRLVDLAPDRFEFATWEEVRDWDIVDLGRDVDPETKQAKLAQWDKALSSLAERTLSGSSGSL